MGKFLGAPYPIADSVYGYISSKINTDLDQIKSDLLILLLTNPGERVHLPNFGTPLRQLLFEPNDAIVVERARQMIIDSINAFEPRITVSQIDVSTSIDPYSLNTADTRVEVQNILSIRIAFYDPANIQSVQSLVLELPLGG